MYYFILGTPLKPRVKNGWKKNKTRKQKGKLKSRKWPKDYLELLLVLSTKLRRKINFYLKGFRVRGKYVPRQKHVPRETDVKFHRYVETCLFYLCPAGHMHARIGMTTDRDICKRQYHADLSKGWPPLVDGNAVYLHRTMSIIDVFKLSTIR